MLRLNCLVLVVAANLSLFLLQAAAPVAGAGGNFDQEPRLGAFFAGRVADCPRDDRHIGQRRQRR